MAASLLVLLAGATAAADDATRQQVEQRIKLSAKLLGDTQAMQRIVASGQAQAISSFEAGRLHHAMAEELLQKGDLAAARREVDDALKALSTARRLAPDMQARQSAARQRYEQQRIELERLIEAWRNHPGPAGNDDSDLVAALGLMGGANHLAEGARFEEAVATLATAESHVLAGMNRSLQSRTLDYTARPSSAAEELQLELARHKGLADLVPLALNELKPRPEALALIDRYGKASSTLRSQAVQRQQGGDVQQALADIRNAILYLQRALSAAGVTTPETPGNPP